MIVIAAAVGWSRAVYVYHDPSGFTTKGNPAQGAAIATLILAGELLRFGFCRLLVRLGWI